MRFSEAVNLQVENIMICVKNYTTVKSSERQGDSRHR